MNTVEIIKKYRVKADLTYMKLAELTGIPYQTLQRICDGKSTPNDRTMEKLKSFYEAYKAEIDKVVNHQ